MSSFYDNVMIWAVRNGFVGINANYQLAPQSPWPAAAEDLSAVVNWASRHVAASGDDPLEFLMGHSAGVVHVATFIAHPEFQDPKSVTLAGAILVSGIYDLAAFPRDDRNRAYFGADVSKYVERSSLVGLTRSTVPLMIAAAELDPPSFVEQSSKLRQELCSSRRGYARAVMLPQHMSEVYSINTSDTALTAGLLKFIGEAK